MLNFNDAIKLAKSEKFIFSIPTKYNELSTVGTIDKNNQYISSKFVLSSEDVVITDQLIELLENSKIENITKDEFKNAFNLNVKNLYTNFSEEEMIENGFTLGWNDNDQAYDDDYDYDYDY